jgi:hypothetical protein
MILFLWKLYFVPDLNVLLREIYARRLRQEGRSNSIQMRRYGQSLFDL